MNAAIIIPILSAFVGSLIGGSLTLFGVVLSQRQLVRRDLVADARGLRNARLERLRVAYVMLIEAASIRHLVAYHRQAAATQNGTCQRL